MSATRQATLRLSLRASFLEKRENWRAPSYFDQRYKDKPALYFPVKVAHLLLAPLDQDAAFAAAKVDGRTSRSIVRESLSCATSRSYED